MNSSIWGYFFLVLGLVAGALLILFSSINTKNEQNYYLLKEVTQNAMLDSVDEVAYQVGLTEEEVNNIDSISCVSGQVGTVRIVTEKFVENFTRRFAESANLNYKYKIIFYDIDECPAKVSLKVVSTQNYSWVRRLFTGNFNIDTDNTNIVNEISAILETKD